MTIWYLADHLKTINSDNRWLVLLGETFLYVLRIIYPRRQNVTTVPRGWRGKSVQPRTPQARSPEHVIRERKF